MHCCLPSGGPRAPPSFLMLTSVVRGYPSHPHPFSFPGESEILGRGLKGDLVQFPYSVQQLPLRRCPTSGRLGTSEISFLETLDLLRSVQPVCCHTDSPADAGS